MKVNASSTVIPWKDVGLWFVISGNGILEMSKTDFKKTTWRLERS